MTQNTLTQEKTFNFKKSVKVFFIFNFISLSVLLGFYVYSITSEVAERGQIRNIETKIRDVNRQNSAIEVALMEKNALNNIMPKIGELNFVKAEKISYIKILDNKVVLNDIR